MQVPFLLALLTASFIGVSTVSTTVVANESASAVIETSVTEKAEIAKLDVVSAKELQNLINTHDDLVIIDSRAPSAYAQGHIPAAVRLVASDATRERLAAFAPAKETPIVFYCGSRQCPASAKTAHKAATAGYTNLYKYADGMADWQSKGLPVVAN